MAQTIVPDPNGDTPAIVADKVRDLPANQGLNNIPMWQKITTEIAAAQTAGTLINNDTYGSYGDTYGNA